VPEDDPLAPGLAAGYEAAAPSPRFARPASKIAENVTVITAEQIAALNAHTLAEVLQTVPGIQINNTRTPGDFTFFTIQGEDDGSGNILLLIDGVSQGNLLQGAIAPGLIPVQHIDRIEIIKGSASATWGAALGGVVNVVTKSPEQGKAVSGTAVASFGERNTANLLADLSGTKGGIGYYLFGGNLHSDGLRPNNGTNRNNLYAKLTYDLPVKGNLTLGVSYLEAANGITAVPDAALDNNKDRRYYSFLNFTYPLLPDLKLDISGQDSSLNSEAIFHLDPSDYVLNETNRGGKARLIYGDNRQGLVLGYDYLQSKITQVNTLIPDDPFSVDKKRDSWALYGNGTLSFDKLTILPGIRYDHTGLSENSTNYTLGATYQLTGKTLLRAYAAKGFSLPSAVDSSIPKRIWTVQTGVETEAIPYLWLKGTFFYNHIWNIQEDDLLKEHNRQGYEIEARTAPLHGLFFSGGYTYTDTRDAETGEVIKSVPVHLAKLSFNYRNAPFGLLAILNGNYAWLNSEDFHLAEYKPIIWNLHLTQKLFPGKELSPEIFFSGHNLFNGTQYWDNWYMNTRRWIEGGVRFRF
jgi:vitamin B12 transporter